MNDREKLIELLDRATRKYRFDAWENTDKIADHLIANDVAIQKHGEWLHRDGAVVCSECEGVCSLMYDYCPSCGAVMDLED